MRMKKVMAVGLAAVMSAAVLSGCGGGDKKGSAEKEQKKVGVVQLTEHAALDAAYKGFKEGLEEAGYKDGDKIKIEYKNAQNEQSTVRPSRPSLSVTSVIWCWLSQHRQRRLWPMRQRIFRSW